MKKNLDCSDSCKALDNEHCSLYGQLECRRIVIINSPIYIPLRHKLCNHVIRTNSELISKCLNND